MDQNQGIAQRVVASLLVLGCFAVLAWLNGRVVGNGAAQVAVYTAIGFVLTLMGMAVVTGLNLAADAGTLGLWGYGAVWGAVVRGFLVVLPFKDEEDLIAQANGTAFGLACGIWTENFKRAWRIGRALEAGCDGVVASGLELPAMRRAIDSRLLVVTPVMTRTGASGEPLAPPVRMAALANALRDRARVEASLELPDGTRSVLQGMDEVAVVIDASLLIAAASAPAELFGMHEGSTLPGDELIPTPTWEYTHAISVDAPPEDVWPWVESLWVLIKPGMVRLKMVSSGEMLGFLSGYEQLSGKVGWISSIGITPAWQGRGLGARLLAAGERALGTPLVRLTVRASNLRAIHLYEQSGYRQIKTIRGYYVGGEDGLVFEKDTRLSQAF